MLQLCSYSAGVNYLVFFVNFVVEFPYAMCCTYLNCACAEVLVTVQYCVTMKYKITSVVSMRGELVGRFALLECCLLDI